MFRRNEVIELVEEHDYNIYNLAEALYEMTVKLEKSQEEVSKLESKVEGLESDLDAANETI
jgi:PHD/YefM family antitoxin component YafN of YafNO toxin-antitoxin module